MATFSGKTSVARKSTFHSRILLVQPVKRIFSQNAIVQKHPELHIFIRHFDLKNLNSRDVHDGDVKNRHLGI